MSKTEEVKEEMREEVREGQELRGRGERMYITFDRICSS